MQGKRQQGFNFVYNNFCKVHKLRRICETLFDVAKWKKKKRNTSKDGCVKRKKREQSKERYLKKKKKKIVVKVVSVYESKENKEISLAVKHTQDDWLLHLVWISS